MKIDSDLFKFIVKIAHTGTPYNVVVILYFLQNEDYNQEYASKQSK